MLVRFNTSECQFVVEVAFPERILCIGFKIPDGVIQIKKKMSVRLHESKFNAKKSAQKNCALLKIKKFRPLKVKSSSGHVPPQPKHEHFDVVLGKCFNIVPAVGKAGVEVQILKDFIRSSQ